ncbi:MAG: reverse transcriptase domain-containing protein [Nanoarchaeota archaeon]|nr:reverse transcriptase domain-containing protein [Nanoarchaeota archaeon]
MSWLLRAVWLNINTDRFNLNCNNNPINNNGRARGMALAALDISAMKTYTKLYDKICSLNNIKLAFRKARKKKSSRPDVQEFEQKLEENLKKIQQELIIETYQPLPLKTFILRDPKTRKISKSDFRDRVVHHAVCNLIEPIFEKRFIHDSYANRKLKGTSGAIKRFNQFKRKASSNGMKVNERDNQKYNNNYVRGYILKADIRKYFDTVDHEVLVQILSKKICDRKVIKLIEKILANHRTPHLGKGMPLGNLTSQFFANVYLNELDMFVKHNLKAKYYLRYVDDFVIFHKNREVLQEYKEKINGFLRRNLLLDLHPQKSRIKPLASGLDFVGYRIFYYHVLLRKRNLRKMEHKLKEMQELYKTKIISKETVDQTLNGWFGYMNGSNTHNLRQSMLKRVAEW